MIITITDVRAAGFCVSGARDWFERHGFDFRDFVRNGLSAQILLDRGDGFAVRVVERKLSNG